MCLFETVFMRHAYAGNKGSCAHPNDTFFKHLYAREYMEFWKSIFEIGNVKDLVIKYKM